jgi:hypothetical protein
MLARLLQALKSSGPCLDSPRLLRLLARPGWFRTLGLHVLRLKFTPVVLERIRALPWPVEERASLFTEGISLLCAGGSFKTTGADRTRLVDETVLRLAARFSSPRVAEVGVSDGSAALQLLKALPPTARLLLTDRHPIFLRRDFGPLRIILDSDGALLGIKLLCLYLLVPFRARFDAADCQRIDTLNPLLSEVHGVRAILAFDALADILPEPASIIKCANILNRAYFTDAQILAATANLTRSLEENGFLVISHNHSRYAQGEAYFVLRNTGGRLVEEEACGGHEALGLFRTGGGEQA